MDHVTAERNFHKIEEDRNFFTGSATSISTWCQQFPPSTQQPVDWIQIECPPDSVEKADIEFDLNAVINEGEKVFSTKLRGEALVSEINKIASKTGCCCGKWMIFAPTSEVDQIWEKIATATFHGKLGNKKEMLKKMKKRRKKKNKKKREKTEMRKRREENKLHKRNKKILFNQKTKQKIFFFFELIL